MKQDKKTRAIEHFKKGCTWQEVADACSVGRNTLWRWSKIDPAFAKAIEEAKCDPDHDVEAVTFANACDPDPAHNVLRMFWLKSRKGYTDRVAVASSVAVHLVDRANNPRDKNRLASVSSNGNGHSGNGVAP